MIDVVWLENDKKLMNRLEDVFMEHGINLIKCTTSTQALHQIQERSYKNLLLDLEFPNSSRDGLLFLEQISKLKLHVNTAILTGYPDLQEAIKLTNENNVVGYFNKPIPYDKKGQQIFFHKLKTSFDKKITDHVDDELLLSQWRKRTWIHLFTTIIFAMIVWVLVSWTNDWDFKYIFNLIKEEPLYSYPAIGLWGLIDLFLVKRLYDQYFNNSNIVNFLNRKRG